MKVKFIKNGNYGLYQIKDGGEIYYPTAYTMNKYLLKNKLQFHTQDIYKPYIKTFDIDFVECNGGLQTCTCMSIRGWVEYTKRVKFGKMNKEQKERHNEFCDIIKSQYKYIPPIEDNLYDDFVKDCIKDYIAENSTYENIKCVKCGRILPKARNFFPLDARNKDGSMHTCRMCTNNYLIHKDRQATNIYRLFGEGGYKLYKENLIDFYIKYVHSNTSGFKLKINYRDDSEHLNIFLKIIKYYYDIGNITCEQFSIKHLRNILNIKMNYILHNKIITEFCSENDCKLRPWKYKNYELGEITYEHANSILNQYILDSNIIIDNILEYKEYSKLLRGARLTQFENNILFFLVQYYNYEYAGYKFYTPSVNYYKDAKMRMFDLKWFIEKDLKIPIPKIPLYVTRYSLAQKASPLYHIINKYYSSLFEWVNECYPDEFNINDFEINPYRSEFDSLEEAQVDDILRQNILNIIHNERNSKNTIKVKGMIPDWIAFTDNNCYLIEYFGLHSDGKIDSSHRLQRYKQKESIKINKYQNMKGYKHLFIYPSDLKNNFKGLKNKILKIA